LREPVAHGFDFEYDTCANEYTFVRCRECDHLYLCPRPRVADLGVIYPPHYYAFADQGEGLVARLRRVWEGGKVRHYRELIGHGHRRVLDIGCGDGRFLELLRDFGPDAWQLVGIDFDASAVAQCRDKGFEAHESRIEDFSGRAGEFDAVIMLQLIEHVENPSITCRRVFELLRPGGHFIVETPNTAGLDFRFFNRSYWGHYHFPRHWNLFSTESLTRTLERHGFEIARVDQLISTSAWTISLHNYFLDRGYPRSVVRFFHFKNPILLGIFVILDSIRAKLGRRTSNQRVVAVRRAV
jgi:2-polyprenyl-3-methyl-5-hydroxy-6-metoxy-1,4-benzoquinol methylase